MKLFALGKKHEGEAFARNAIISAGNCIRGDNSADGWYFKIEFPFKKVKDYLDATTFKDTNGPCRYVIVFRYRPKAASKYFSIKAWVPVNE